MSSGSAGNHTGADPVIQGTGKGMLRGGATEEARDGPSLQSPDLRMNNRGKCYVAERDLGPGHTALSSYAGAGAQPPTLR